MDKTYIAIDLKSFYASVECVDRGLDPLQTNLVVADVSRTEKTICLAVTPALKQWGIPGRARLFEVVQKVREVNARRKQKAPGRQLTGTSVDAEELRRHTELALDYITAPPQMAHYMEYSTRIYKIYLRYFAPEDMHVYSIDEVFIDATGYLHTYGLSGQELARKVILEVLRETGITATAGIGSNLYLCKVAMDVYAKHIPPDENGVRIAELNELTYREQFWTHRPLTDFWRIGRGYAARLEDNGMYTMGDVARCSLQNEDFLYKLFGINAELLIDHAWGQEAVTIADIKAYKPENSSIGNGQVLQHPYDYEKARLVLREMADALALQLVEKRLITDQIILLIGYDIENLTNSAIKDKYRGSVITDAYGRSMPKPAHGSANLEYGTSSARVIVQAAAALFDSIVDRHLLIRRINIAANHVLAEDAPVQPSQPEQMNFFTDYERRDTERLKEKALLEKEKKQQRIVLCIKEKYGKNAILKGMNLAEGATAMERNGQIGGHKA